MGDECASDEPDKVAMSLLSRRNAKNTVARQKLRRSSHRAETHHDFRLVAAEDARLSLALTSVVVSGVQLELFERPLNDDPIRHVFVTLGFLSEEQAFESDRSYRNAIELDRLGILA
jgi:hypothetical protein